MEQALDPHTPFAYGRFDDQVGLITGGSQGLGYATAELLASRGAAGLVIVGRDADKGTRAAQALSTSDCRVVFVAADLAEAAGVAPVMDALDAEFGRVDTFINCAAATWRGTVWNTTADMWDAMLAINVRMPGLFITECAKMMKARSTAGTIVLVSSIAHHGGSPILWPYSTSKHALEVMAKSAAFSLAAHRIRVNVVNPGWMNTPAEHDVQKRFHDAPDNWLELAAESRPFGRILEPAEVARVLCFAASAESGMMTGATIDMDQTIPGVGDLPIAEEVPEYFPWQDR